MWTFTALVDWGFRGPVACPRSRMECCRALFWWRSVAAGPAVFVCLRWVVCVACTPRTPTIVVCTYPGRRRGRGRFSSVLVLAFVFAFRIGSYFLANTIHPSLPPWRGIRGALMSGDSWVSYFTRDDESSKIRDGFEADEWTRLLVVGIKTIAGIDWESMVISRAGLSHNDYHVVVDSIF